MLLFDRGATLASCIQTTTATLAISTLTWGVCNIDSQPKTQILPRSATTRMSVRTARPQPRPRVLPTARPIKMPLKLHPYVNCAVQKCLALTFDDGPDARTTPQLLQQLRHADARATFFVLGSQVQKYPVLTRQIEGEGHQIGSHSWGHGDFTQMTPAQMKEDLAHTNAVIQATGVAKPYLFRPPFGAHNEKVDQTVPMSLVLWSVDPEDWATESPAKLAQQVIAQAKPGGIVVLHDIQSTTVAAAAKFIPGLRKKYHLVTVEQLMGIDAHTPKATYVGF